MRETYHIIIEKDEQSYLDKVFAHLEVEPEMRITMNSNEENTIHYIVDLSKYELLLVRLSARTGKIVPVPNKE